MKLSKYIKTRCMIVRVISVLIESYSAGYICLGRHTPGGMFHLPISETAHSQHLESGAVQEKLGGVWTTFSLSHLKWANQIKNTFHSRKAFNVGCCSSFTDETLSTKPGLWLLLLIGPIISRPAKNISNGRFSRWTC